VRTQVAIIGAGPAGLLLSHLLHLQGVESVVLERRDEAYVRARVRAGVLENGTSQMLREVGLGERMDRDGMPHDGTELRFGGRGHRIDFVDLTAGGIVVYGQQEVVKDLIDRRRADDGDVRFEVADVCVRDSDTARPWLTFVEADEQVRLDCDIVIAADGSHSEHRALIPDAMQYGRDYPFAWLGIIARAPPSSPELIYARGAEGFALHSMRSPTITRMYLQVAPEESIADWSDDRIWEQLHARLADDRGFELTEGPLLDKSITPMRSAVLTPMQHGRLYLAGDAAHVVPPTGAKGMNLALADVRVLSRALGAFFADARTELLDAYTETVLRRVWRATYFSWWMTSMLHVDPDDDAFGDRLALAQLENVVCSRALSTALAENYIGLPYDAGWSYR